MSTTVFRYVRLVIRSTGTAAVVCVVLGMFVRAQDEGPSPRSGPQASTVAAAQQRPGGQLEAKPLLTLQAASSGTQTGGPEVPFDRQIITGRLVCAQPWEASQTCGHSKNESAWGCKLYCAKGPDGTQYALQTVDKAYLVNGGDPKQLKHFAAYDVAVTGELSQGVVDGSSILKRAKGAKHEKGAVLESTTR